MKKYAFNRRRTVNQRIWVIANSPAEARALAASGYVDETDDEDTLSMMLKRLPADDGPIA